MESVKDKEIKFFDQAKEKFGYENVMQSPRLEKIVISSGVGKIKTDKNKLEVIQDRLAKITGQKVAYVPAKKSIATFKTREGDISGYKVTLRGKRMYAFLDKVLNIALPRTKDFRGIKVSAVDKMGNLTMGVKEHIIFPETGDEELRNVFGMSITVVSSAKSQEEAFDFFSHLGVPFKKEESK